LTAVLPENSPTEYRNGHQRQASEQQI